MTSSRVEITIGATQGTPSGGVAVLEVDASKRLLFTDDAGNTITAPTIRENETFALKPQQNTGSSATPTGNVSTVAKMMGLGLVSGFTITPQVTGRVAVWIAGTALNSTAAGDGTSITGKYGTGTAPSNAAASSGTTFGAQQNFIASTTAGQQGFICMGIVTGLTLNVAVWFDLVVVAVTAGGASVKDCQIIVVEL